MPIKKNEEFMLSTQKDGAPEKGKETAKKSAGEVLSFYLTVINQCVDLVIKMGPVFMMGAGMMLWSYLREIGWTHLLLPTASSPSGLAFLAISALMFVGMAILAFLIPSIIFSPVFDPYPNRLIPKRVPWILAGMIALLLAYLEAVGLIDGFADEFSTGWMIVSLYLAGVLGYAAPGLAAACRDWEKQGQSGNICEKCRERSWRTIFREHWLMLRSEDAEAPGGGGLKDNDGGAEHNNTKEVPVWIDWIRPLWVVLLAWGVVLMTSFPVLVLIQFWGEQLEFRLGTALAIFLIMVAAGSAVLPAYIYLYVRSRNENAVIAAKRASMAVVPLVLIAVLAMTLHAPIRDRVFHALGIQGPQEEYFLISSPMAAQALSMFGFPKQVMSLRELDLQKQALVAGANVEGKLDGTSEQDVAVQSGTSVQQTKTAPDSSLKLDTPLVVKAWVGYSFGDTVLLCKWQAGERRKKREAGSDDGHLKNNVCVPLARSELRRISSAVSAEKAAK